MQLLCIAGKAYLHSEHWGSFHGKHKKCLTYQWSFCPLRTIQLEKQDNKTKKLLEEKYVSISCLRAKKLRYFASDTNKSFNVHIVLQFPQIIQPKEQCISIWCRIFKTFVCKFFFKQIVSINSFCFQYIFSDYLLYPALDSGLLPM